MNESSLGVHEIELSVELGPGLADGRRVGERADGALDLGEVAAGNDGGRLPQKNKLTAFLTTTLKGREEKLFLENPFSI